MSDNSIQSHYVPYIDQLPALSRILHHLCFYNLFPRDPILLKVNEQDMFFISMLLSKRSLNFPGSILSYISNVVSKDLSLPYGGILTRVFEHFEVDLDCIEYVLRTPIPSTMLDQLYLTTLEQEDLSKSKEKQPRKSFGIIVGVLTLRLTEP